MHRPFTVPKSQHFMLSFCCIRAQRRACCLPGYVFMSAITHYINQMASNSRDLSSFGSGDHTSKLKVWAGPRSLCWLQGRLLLASSSSWRAPGGPVSVATSLSSLPLCPHGFFSLGLSSSDSYKGTSRRLLDTLIQDDLISDFAVNPIWKHPFPK